MQAILPTVAVRKAARIVNAEGVVAYPTEGVYGLGCLPGSATAAARILTIKERDPAMGLVLIASHPQQLEPWVAAALSDQIPPSSLARPLTWIVPSGPNLPYWIGGDHDGVAVRITRHPIAAALCDAADSALVSTSANRSGTAPARTVYVLRRRFGNLVDFVVPGDLGPASGPSEIRALHTGTTVRSATP